MALKHKIGATEWAQLPALIKAEYGSTADAEGNHILDVEGLEDVSVLKRTIDHIKAEKKKLSDKATSDLESVRAELEALRSDHSKGDEKLTAAEKRHQALLKKREDELTGEVNTMRNALTSQLVDSVALQLSSEVATNSNNAEILSTFLKKQLKAEIREGKAVTVFLDDAGVETVLTPKEGFKKMLDSKRYDALITGNKSSGSGGSGSKPGSAGKSEPKKIGEMNATEQAQFANKNPEAYRQYLSEKSQ